jgi:hypothetical protein
MANRQMKWLITKGENLLVDETKYLCASLCWKFWPGNLRRTTWDLLACDADDAPQRSEDYVCEPFLLIEHRLTCHQNVYRVATLIVDLDDVPASSIRARTNSYGQQYFLIDCVVHISIQSSLEFFVTVDGEKYGSLTAKYE